MLQELAILVVAGIAASRLDRWLCLFFNYYHARQLRAARLYFDDGNGVETTIVEPEEKWRRWHAEETVRYSHAEGIYDNHHTAGH